MKILVYVLVLLMFLLIINIATIADMAFRDGHARGYNEGYLHGKKDAMLDVEDDGK